MDASPDPSPTFAVVHSIAATQCLRAAREVARGESADAGVFEPAPCPAEPPAPAFALDPRSGTVRVVRNVTAGEYVRTFWGFGAARVRAGDMLTMRVHWGAVLVQRPVRALQAAGDGERLFVRTEDGATLSATFEAGQR